MQLHLKVLNAIQAQSVHSDKRLLTVFTPYFAVLAQCRTDV